jgi:biopolymer transport protein ExbB
MEAIQQTIMYFHKGGLVMWPLLFCSIAVIAIAIERFLFYKGVDSGAQFATQYCSLLRDDNTAEALQLAEASKGECAQIVAAADKIEGGNEQKKAFMESQAGIFIAKLKDKLDYLSIIVTMSPLLGLLGTIVGMIGAFSIFNLQAGAPIAITSGIGEALIATATGLCVAIISLCAHSYFAHRMDNMITDMEQCFSALLEAGTRSGK